MAFNFSKLSVYKETDVYIPKPFTAACRAGGVFASSILLGCFALALPCW